MSGTGHYDRDSTVASKGTLTYYHEPTRQSSPSQTNHRDQDSQSNNMANHSEQPTSPPFKHSKSWKAIDQAYAQRVADEQEEGTRVAAAHERRRLELSLAYRRGVMTKAMRMTGRDQ